MAPSAKPKVLFVNEPDRVARNYVQQMKELVEIHIVDQAPHDILAERISRVVKENGPFVACVTFMKWTETWPWPLDEGLVGPLIDSGCKLFSSGGAGFDWVDIDYLTSKGVYYANTPESGGYRTADSAAMMILQILRGASEREADARAGRWLNHRKPAKDTRRSTLGIIGMGHIGKLVAQHMQHFGMKVVYNNRNRLPPEEENGAEFVSFDEILQKCDVLSLHCPLTPSTRHLLNKETFAKMRDGIIIVNTSRGPVIDENALVEALESGKVLRAALDVYEFEPKIHPGLINSMNTTLQPHCAVVDENIMMDQQTEIMENLEQFIKTGKPISPVNKIDSESKSAL